MVTKLIASIITLFVGSLIAHENFNQISANINPLELGTSYIKLDHQSFFNAPNGDILILHLSHSPHMKYFQNEIGVGYRKFFPEFGVGANLYYMNMTQPSFMIHQLSPGIELFYRDFMLTFNTYLPTSQKRTFRKGDLYHSTISELGLRYSPRKDFNVGLMPFYDHMRKQWGLNSRISYTYNDRLEFALSPYFKRQGSGCMFSFAVNFGGLKSRGIQSTYRSNEFAYLVAKKQSKIHFEAPVRVMPIPAPIVVMPPQALPIVEEAQVKSEEVEIIEVKLEEEIIEPKKEEEIKPTNWWNFIPFIEYKGSDYAKKEKLSRATSHAHDFFFVPPLELMIPGAKQPSNLNNVRIIEDYCVTEVPQTQTPHILPVVIIEDYLGQTSTS